MTLRFEIFEEDQPGNAEENDTEKKILGRLLDLAREIGLLHMLFKVEKKAGNTNVYIIFAYAKNTEPKKENFLEIPDNLREPLQSLAEELNIILEFNTPRPQQQPQLTETNNKPSTTSHRGGGWGNRFDKEDGSPRQDC